MNLFKGLVGSALFLLLSLLNTKLALDKKIINAKNFNIRNIQATAADNCGGNGSDCTKEMRKVLV